MKKLIIFSLLTLYLAACVELDEERPGDQTKTFTGHLYKNCEKEPFANMELNIYKENDKTFSSDETFFTQVVTDENGAFYFEFKNKGFDRFNVYNNTNNLVCRIGVTGDSWLYEPNQTSELYSRTRLRHPIKILTDKAYTVQDTLLVSVTGNLQPIFSMNGPFINNHIYMSDLLSYGNLTDLIAPFSNSSETRVDFYWGIGIKDMQRSIGLFRNNNPQAVPRVPQRVCDGDTVVIDLRRKQ
jgi:hypothetical protein